MTWIKSSQCDTSACVEVQWVRAKCDAGNCVEVAQTKATDGELLVLVRNSTNPEGPIVTFTADEWGAFTQRVMLGDFAV